jgi:hypothetical protein
MKEKAQQLLQNMDRQLAHLNEQVLMTQAAIQILQLLLADSEESEPATREPEVTERRESNA